MFTVYRPVCWLKMSSDVPKRSREDDIGDTSTPVKDLPPTKKVVRIIYSIAIS